MKRLTPLVVLIICLALLVAITLLKFLYPDFVYFNSGFVLVILLTILLRRDIYTWLFAGFSILIIAISIYLAEHFRDLQTLLPQAISSVVVLLSLLVVLHIKNLYRGIDSEKSYLDALFKHATEGIILTNSAGQIVLANPAALRLFNYEESELIGKVVEVLLPKRVHDKHVAYRGAFYNEPSSRTMGHGRDLYARSKDGTEFPVEVSLSHFKQKNEAFVIAFIVDITERKSAEKRMIEQRNQLEQTTNTIRKLNAELETKVEERTLILKEALLELERSQQELSEALEKEKELNEIKSRFVSMASHEFRTPLSTVLSSAALIGRYTKTEEQDRRDKHVQRIKDSVKHLNDLLEDFLSLGKLEEGKIAASGEEFLVREFLEDVSEEMRTILKAGQQIYINIEGETVFITDRKLLKNIMINLISNAAKFSAEHSAINVNAIVDSSVMRISVNDEGIGIAEEDLQHLFTSFFRGRNAVNIQGTGLGLHIIKRYLDLVNGEVNLTSELGKGTTITVTLPKLQA